MHQVPQQGIADAQRFFKGLPVLGQRLGRVEHHRPVGPVGPVGLVGITRRARSIRRRSSLADRDLALAGEAVEVIKPGTAAPLILGQVERLGLGDAARGDPHAER